MRSATAKSLLEEVTSAVFVLLLFANFVTSVDVIVTKSTDSHDSPGSSVARSNTPTNNERHNGSGQPKQLSNATQDAISRKQKQDAHIRIIRDRERWKFRLLDRVWEFLRKSSAARSHVNSIDSVDSRGFHSLSEEQGEEEEENVRNDREHSELTTYIYLPQCSGPRNFTGEWNDDSTNFRLYFKMDSLEALYRLRDIKVNSTFLYIKKKPSLVFGSHRPALTSARPARQRFTGSDAGSGSNGRAPSLRRRPTRDTERSASSSSSSSSPSFSRPDAGWGAINNLKIVVNSFRKNRQEMRPVAVTPVSRQSTEWIRISLTQVVDDWLKRPARNLGLQVTLRSNVLSSSSELNPDDYFEGTNCSNTAPTDRGSLDADQSSPIHVWSSERSSISQSSVDWTSAHLENITNPFLEVVTVQVPRSRPRHRRHVKPDHRFEIGLRDHDADRLKSSTVGKRIQSLRSSDAESHSSQTPHSSLASDSAFPLME